MTQQQIEGWTAAFERAVAHYGKTPEGARAALQAAGIIDEKGEFTEHYRPNVQSETEPDSRLPRVRSND